MRSSCCSSEFWLSDASGKTALHERFSIEPEWLDRQISLLPYSLTGAQRRAIEDLRHDLASGQPMNRLLQGDVGSGKTVVAALAIAMVTHEGAQAALMAPTSILAEQHYKNLLQLLAAQPQAAGVDDLPDAIHRLHWINRRSG